MRPRKTNSRPARRAGLAPLELVLSLPLLLFVMALMIVFGTAGAWKVRALANARQAGWRALEGRDGQGDPHPRGWPDAATMTRRDTGPPAVTEDPLADHAVVRGPVLVPPNGGANGQALLPLPVFDETLDFQAGVVEGYAQLERKWPLFQRMPRGGKLNLSVHDVLLDGTRWQHWSMRILNEGYEPTSISNDGYYGRRILTLYDLSTLVQGVAAAEIQRYQQAVFRIYYRFYEPVDVALTPIDGYDPEIVRLLGGHGRHNPPGASVGCSLDPIVVYNGNVRPLLRRIDNQPRDVSARYISYYQQRIDIEQSRQPPNQALIQELQRKIDEINAFLRSVPPAPPRP